MEISCFMMIIINYHLQGHLEKYYIILSMYIVSIYFCQLVEAECRKYVSKVDHH